MLTFLGYPQLTVFLWILSSSITQLHGTSSSRSFYLRRRVSLVWLLYGGNFRGKAAILGTLYGAFLNANHGNSLRLSNTNLNKRKNCHTRDILWTFEI